MLKRINAFIEEYKWIIFFSLFMLILLELRQISSRTEAIWDYVGSIYDNTREIKDYSSYSYDVLEEIKRQQ